MPSDGPTWYLEGGMALAAHTGGFVRLHSDIDVGIFVDDVLDFEARIAENQYRLFSRNPVSKFLEYTRVDLVRPTSGKEIQSVDHVKRLTAIKVDDRGNVDNCARILPRFDVHIHRKDHDTVYVTKDRVAFPSDLFHQNKVFETTKSSILVASIPFIYFFKSQGRRPKERFDRDLIEQRGLIAPLEKKRILAIVDGRRVNRGKGWQQCQPPIPRGRQTRVLVRAQ